MFTLVDNEKQKCINILKDKLIDNLEKNSPNKNKEYSYNTIKNFEFEFRPGLFFSAILEGKSLILKNLPNLHTEVLERFNELFSTNPSLTINEDIYDTFTNESKYFCEFSNNFRIISTCSDGFENNLSEAALSRLTLIYVNQYLNEEIKYIITNMNQNNTCIDYLFNKIMKFNKEFQQHISLRKINTIIQIFSNNFNNEKMYINKIFQFFTKGLIRVKQDKYLIYENEFFCEEDIKEYGNIIRYKDLIEENALKKNNIKMEYGFNQLESKFTNKKISIIPKKDKSQIPDIVFNPSIIEILEIIHFSFISHEPLILDGENGQGKKTAIEYIINSLGYEVVNIKITSNTKVEDLFGKEEEIITKNNETKIKENKNDFLLALTEKQKEDNTVIVIHDINYASPSVIDKIREILEKKEENIFLPNGKTVKKNENPKIICIYNSQTNLIEEKLPSSLLEISLYYYINPLTKDERKEIILKKFSETKFKDEANSFINDFKNINNLCVKEGIENIFNLNDISKYIDLRNQVKQKENINIVKLLFFVYRFNNLELMEKIKKELNIIDDFSPIFTFNQLNCIIQLNKN